MLYKLKEVEKLIAAEIGAMHHRPYDTTLLRAKLYENGENCIQDLFFQDLQRTNIYQEIVDADESSCLWSSQVTDNDGYFTYFSRVNGVASHRDLKGWQYEKLDDLIYLVLVDIMKIQGGKSMPQDKKSAGIRDDHDFWTPAIEFMTDNMDPNYAEAFKEYCDRQGFNANEIIFFRNMVQDAFASKMATAIIGLKVKEQDPGGKELEYTICRSLTSKMYSIRNKDQKFWSNNGFIKETSNGKDNNIIEEFEGKADALVVINMIRRS